MNFHLKTKIPDDDKRKTVAEDADRRVTVGLLGASFGTKNLGIAALACGTVASICHSFPNVRIFLLDYGKDPAIFQVAHPGGFTSVELINIRFSKRIYLSNHIVYLLFLAIFLRIVPSRQLRARLLQRNHVLKTILEADIIGSIAGGDSFSDTYGFVRLIYVTLPQFLVLLLGKPLVLLPQTFGPFKGALAKTIARYTIRHSKTAYSRDTTGLEATRKIIGRNHGRLEFSHDMGFALEPRIRDERIPTWLAEYDYSIPLVGLNVSGLLYIGGYTHNNMFGIKGDYRRLIHALIYFFARKHSAHVMLVPHVLGVGEESDVIACRKIYDDTEGNSRPHLHLLEEEYDQHEIKYLIGRCNFFLGSRMHSCIAAISQCVPAVGLAYSQKFHGVFSSVGTEKLVIDIREHDEHAVIESVENAYKRRIELRAQLEEKIPVVRTAVLGLFSRLSIELAQREG